MPLQSARKVCRDEAKRGFSSRSSERSLLWRSSGSGSSRRPPRSQAQLLIALLTELETQRSAARAVGCGVLLMTATHAVELETELPSGARQRTRCEAPRNVSVEARDEAPHGSRGV